MEASKLNAMPASLFTLLLLCGTFAPTSGLLPTLGGAALATEEDVPTIVVTGTRGRGAGRLSPVVTGTGGLNPATARLLGDDGEDYAENQPCGKAGSTNPSCTCPNGEEQELVGGRFYCRVPPCGEGSTSVKCTCPAGELRWQEGEDNLFVCREADWVMCKQKGGDLEHDELYGQPLSWCAVPGAPLGNCWISFGGGRELTRHGITKPHCYAYGLAVGTSQWYFDPDA